MKKRVDPVLYDKISRQMAKYYGKLKEQELSNYYEVLMALESNLLILHRQDPSRNSRRAEEAIKLSLFTIDGHIRDIEYDFKHLLSEENKSLLHGLLYCFDPYYSQEIKELIGDKMVPENKKRIKEYYSHYIKCLLRLEESIKLWDNNLGINGYFIFLEDVIGDLIKGDDLIFNVNVTPLMTEEEIRRRFLDK